MKFNPGNILKFQIAVIFTLFVLGCANIVAPTGGEKDKIAPKLTSAEPDTFSTQFIADQIILDFDEFITIKDPTQILISPPMKIAPVYKVRGKKIIVELNDSLRRNTTYSINFGEAISDITEGNKLENFQYVFSTGDHIDSLSVSGNILMAEDGTPEKNILIMLYDNQDDSTFTLKQPDYFTRSNESGGFTLNYLKSGDYKLYALQDHNLNFFYDQPGTESIAYYDELIHVTDSTKPVSLLLFNEEPKKLFLKESFSSSFGKLTLVFNKRVDDFEIISSNINSDTKQISVWNDKRDTVRLWFSNPYLDSVHLIIAADELLDTITESIDAVEKDSVLAKENRFQLVESKQKGKGVIKLTAPLHDVNSEYVLEFNHPVAEIDAAMIHVFEDSLTEVNAEASRSEKNPGKIILRYDWMENHTYQVIIDRNALTDIFGLKNEKIEKAFTTTQEADYGKVIFSLTNLDTSKLFILQLTNDQGKLIASERLYHESAFKKVFELLKPGNYKLKLVVDSNGDGMWTTGDYFNHLQPETIFFYSGQIQIKANWELELLMDYALLLNPLRKKM